jgi:Xaa-Pro aminopeptidase
VIDIERGFHPSEFERRLERAQAAMHRAQMDALLLTTEADFRYWSGFQSQFWESPTRPWFLVVPNQGKPIAVVPEIGATSLASTWLDDIRTWPAPRPADDGVTLLAATVLEVTSNHHRLGVPLGHESYVRMPLADFERFRELTVNCTIADARPLVRSVRAVKSAAEIDKVRTACELTSRAFERLPAKLALDMTERAACKILQLDVLESGADATPYLIGASGAGGYDNIIMGPGDRRLATGDVLVIDTGSVFDGYFCDFDRNFAFGQVSSAVQSAYETVFAATEAGYEAARPGVSTSEIWSAMWSVLERGGALGEQVGRMGHGLGMQLTEWPSIMPSEHVVLQPGMVITLEPGMEFAPGKLMVHEENIVVRDDGVEWLSRRAPGEIPIIE